ncbi:uncharacterized protein A1O9_04135 [Exophiala aquamarina CBS 119918]|uniref:Aquaporin rerated protein, other eukaryote n=1 Tax=Exophiala aquamarina CBS 119918 TaxID=1182545 RepID=A0A072PHI6_9EURO|nr:uncharacterized protein A1O9_04135 [Exophiala aquamarina CBS 119918]KEF59291.1 hypothetical protein A1O9_04135 [Exophiala aquamarina CBS 119918]
MSAESVSELPIHYGEVQKDGTRIERPSEERTRGRSLHDEAEFLVINLSQSAMGNRPPASMPDKDMQPRSSRDETRNNRGTSHSRPGYPPTSARAFDGGKSSFGRNEYRRNVRQRMRHDDNERYSGYDDGYDEPHRPRRIQQRAYYPGDEYSIRRRPSRASRYGTTYSQDPPRTSLEDDDEEPYRPRRFRSQRKSLASQRPFVEHQGDEYEGQERANHEEYARDGSPGNHKPFRFTDLTREEKRQIMRLPLTQWMDSSFKNHFVATLGEFIGKTMFLWFAFAGTQVANIPSGNSANNSTSGGETGFSAISLLYIAIVFGFSLMVNVWVFFRISGGLFNPAVTLAMWMTSAIPLVRAVCLVSAQVAGSVAASALVLVQFPTALNVRTTLAGGTSLVQGVFIEAVLTAELVFTILMLAKEKHKATFVAPVGIGLALFIAELVGVFYTGGSLNPARSLGPCVVTRTFDSEHWIYWVGPGAGALAAVLFYKFIKMLEYEVANPGQDAEDTTEAAIAAQEKRGGRAIGTAL